MIRFTFKYLKPVALFLSIVILLQCCVVYDKRPVTIDEAINVNYKKVKRIKIEFANDDVLILDSIYYKNGELFGLVKSKEVITYNKSETRYRIDGSSYLLTYSVTERHKMEVKIDEDEIAQIRIQNIKKSRGCTSLLILVPLFTGLLLLVSCINKCFMVTDCKCF